MANELIKKIRTNEGDLQIDYNALANKPTTDTTLTVSGQAADAKAVTDALNNISDDINTRFSNPNLLINSDFRNPVNQREQTTYSDGSANTTTNVTYTIDRWAKRNYGSSVIVNDGYIRFKTENSNPTDTGSLTYAFVQSFENPSLFFGNTYTLSVKVKAVNGLYRIGIWQGAKTGFVSEVAASGTPYKEISQAGIYTITFTVNNSFNSNCSVLNVGLAQFSMMVSEGSYIDVEWIKLEQGTIVTPFVPRPYVEELMMCQRYYKIFDKTPIFATNSTSAVYFMPAQFGIPMRTNDMRKSLEYVMNGSYVTQEGVTLNNCNSTEYNVANITFSKTIGQYGYVTMAFDAEIY